MALTSPPVPESPPAGSIATDVDAIIPSHLLNYLTATSKGLLLSARSIGASTLSKIETALEVVDNLAGLAAFQIDGSSLNSLASGDTSSGFTVANVGASNFVQIDVLLGEFQPTSGGRVVLQNSTTAYEVELASTLSEKRVRFANVPASFASMFTVTNLTGASFPPANNCIVVTRL